jgi:outer membrane protein OmpA-like peptidoglycan-associated protein
MTGAARSLAVVLCCFAWPVYALDLSLPTNAQETAARDSALYQQPLPIAPYADGVLPVRTLEGPVTRRAYRIPSSRLTPLQILAPLRDQLKAAGYTVLLDCNQDACGGFDFRFAIDVLPAPNMYVNIRAYHFLSAELPGTDVALTLLASAGAGAGYLQVIQIGGERAEHIAIAEPDVTAPVAPVVAPDDIVAELLEQGHVVLSTLEFAVGTTTLDGGENAELAAIATFMEARPALQIAVVGHTDTLGGLETNIAVSRDRAQAVRTALIDEYGVAPERVEADGMGYLAPIASNLTDAGREANRRVEVIIVGDDG